MSDSIDWDALFPGMGNSSGGDPAMPPPGSYRTIIAIYRQIVQGLVNDGAADYEARILADMHLRPMLDWVARGMMGRHGS